ncbi:MAG: TIGR03960 family B12-binding radical SAM protein, partial [Sandaracinaceae bacterium]|nr:TIGR03960 family B12-binding radical SAM protein [Sandaracinaceae bacterium]
MSLPPKPPSFAEHPYAAFLDRVEKPARYVGGEYGQVRKPWDSVDCRFCLAFPDVYEVGMSHLGYKILYSILNRHERILAERAYAPWFDMEAELRAHNEPLRSLESGKPLFEFDIVGFSLQYELTYTNVLLMLELGGIPLRSEDRGEKDPLVVVGGPVATHAEPLAPFFDCAVIGDGEEKAVELAIRWVELKKQGLSRQERLRMLAEIEGIYVPSLYDTQIEELTGMRVIRPPEDPRIPFPIRRTFVPDLSKYPFPADGPVSATESVFDRVSIEIARGCTEGCRFCQAGMIYRPVRERSPQSILETVSKAICEGGYDEVSLTSLSTADYSAINPLIKALVKQLEGDRVAISVSSLRAYGLSEDLLDEIRKVRATGLTFAPEAGSQRMRDVINKNITEEQLLTTAERVFSRGWTKMKLYFMIGLPTEEEEDVRAIVRTAARMRDIGYRYHKGRVEVTASCSIHVPKPHTPFQWCAMDSKELVTIKKRWLEEEARAHGIRLKLHPTDASWLEGVFARGDRSLAKVLEIAYRLGARFDSWEERFQWSIWAQAFEQAGVDPSPFLGTIPVNARLPWDHIDVGLEDGFLLREYRKALQNRLSPPCGKVAGSLVHPTNVRDAEREKRRLVCYDCGIACDLNAMRKDRIDFLRSLGAIEPPPPPSKAQAEPAPSPSSPRALRRLRLGYRKIGRGAYRSHLDLVRILPRIFRRAKLPLAYTQGYHPKPDLTLGPALSLGIGSLSEYLDIKLDAQAPFSLEGLAERLNAVSEADLEFFGAVELGPN